MGQPPGQKEGDHESERQAVRRQAALRPTGSRRRSADAESSGESAIDRQTGREREETPVDSRTNFSDHIDAVGSELRRDLQKLALQVKDLGQGIGEFRAEMKAEFAELRALLRSFSGSDPDSGDSGDST